MEVLDPTRLVEIRESMDYSENPMSHISNSLKLLKIHKKTYLCGVNEGILQDHITSLKHGLEFLRTFLQVSENKDLRQRIECSVSYVRKKLYSLGYLLKDENLVTKLEHAYADLREEMKNVIIKPGTNEYDVIFPKIFTWGYVFGKTSLFLCEKVKKLMNTDCKAVKIRPMLKELEDIRKMLTYYLEPFFIYAKDADRNLSVKEEDKKIFATITAVLDRATCISYLSFVGKINDKMILSFRNGVSNLIIEETRIVKMYLILDIDSIGNLESHISMSLRLLEWKKRSYLDTEMGARLEDHFLSINNGLQLLVKILKMSTDIDLKWRIQHLVVIIKQKLYSLPHNQKNENLMVNMDHANGESRILRMPRDVDLRWHVPHLVAIVKQKLHSLLNNHKDENLIVNLEHLFGELRKDMQNVVIKPETKDNYTLFPEILMNGHGFSTSKDLSKTIDFLLGRIRKLVTSSCKADQISPIMNELEELGKKLKSLRPFFDYVMLLPNPFALKKEEEKIFAALTTFVDRATCLIYLSFVGKLNEDMLVLLRKNFSLLIEETEIKEMSLVLGIILDEDLESDIDISLSLLERQGACHIGSMDEVILKDHIMSLKHGIEFLKWLPKIFTDRDFERRIILLAVNVKQELESLTHKQGSGSLNMDVNGAYADLREQMKNVIISPTTNKCDTLLADLYPRMSYFRGDNDFILEKIRILLTSNCKADQIAPLKKELQELQKMLTSLKPLCRYVGREIHSLGNADNIITTLLTFHHKATFLVYLSFIRKMDKEIVLSIKSDISTAMKEIDVQEMYTMIFNHFLSDSRYLKDELYLLENLIVLLKSNVESLNDACSKLYEVLIDIQIFLLGLYPNMFLRKLHLLAPSLQAILGHSIPIVCSCYLEHVEEDISAELKCVHDLIKYIKFESQEMKLYYFPRADDLGFVEFFSGYLEDLMKTQEISLEEEIGALHFEVRSLMSLAKIRNRELNGTPWSDVINMAYQSEYIIDLYLLRSSRDLELIESLSKIIEQLKNIREDVHGLSCRSLPAQDIAVISNPQVLGKTTPVINNDAIVDLQDEAKIIAEYLLTGENKLDVISIVGMAGVGKTTLASTLFKSTPNHFDVRAWCTISQSYKSRDLLLTMLDQVNAFDKNHRSILDDEELADHFCKCLKKRRYLVVLDDIWDTGLWDYLKFYLPDDRKGSRILITTRNRDVADNINSKVNELHQLSEEKSLILFQKMMLQKENISKDLLKISKGIVEHCKGLPLSIVIVAGILSGIERTEKNWNKIAESVSSVVLSDPQGKCKAILKLSYNHLPNHLRSCFLYLGSFPEDKEISMNHLTTLWIAEGLVRDTESDSAEGVAKKYIEDLIAKSLVITAKERSVGGVKTFRLHDLLRDFCMDKAKEKLFLTVLDKRNNYRPLQDPRRLVIDGPSIKDLDFSCHSIRSIICYDKFRGC